MAWGGCVGYSYGQSVRHGVNCQLVYILCGVLSMGDLRLVADHLSGRLECVDVLISTMRKCDIQFEERLTAMGLFETDVG